MGSIIPALSRVLSINSYSALDVAQWFELFMGVSLSITGNERDQVVNYTYEDVICAIQVDEDGVISEFIDLDEESVIGLDQEVDYVTNTTPNVYDSFEDFRAAVKREYVPEYRTYSAKVLSSFKKAA